MTDRKPGFASESHLVTLKDSIETTIALSDVDSTELVKSQPAPADTITFSVIGSHPISTFKIGILQLTISDGIGNGVDNITSRRPRSVLTVNGG